MKFKFDLLPNEYKSLPRDTLGIALAVLTIIASITAVGTMYIKNKSALNDVQAQVDIQENLLRDLVNKTSQLQPPTNEINSLKNSINFINQNLDTPGTSWVDFLASLESAVPERVVINDISPKVFNKLNGTFTIIGEASSIFDALEFAKSLNQTGKFQAFLKNNTNVTQNEGSIQKFTLDFTYKP
ncbi:MAG: hypothetical protein Kow0029_22520 [Candidatus Rifleibacteriota bacterium]